MLAFPPLQALHGLLVGRGFLSSQMIAMPTSATARNTTAGLVFINDASEVV